MNKIFNRYLLLSIVIILVSLISYLYLSTKNTPATQKSAIDTSDRDQSAGVSLKTDTEKSLQTATALNSSSKPSTEPSTEPSTNITSSLPILAPVSTLKSKNNNAKVAVKTLQNGLKILVKKDNRAPVAVIQVWYRIGTSYEHEGITGLSHALEHMMFKGTKTRASGEFEKTLAVNGARNNAFTSQDYTAYYEVIASERLEVAMELEADRMRNLVLDEKEFEKEIEVVKEERRWRTDDKPASLTREQFNAIAFLNSPYRAPVIGWMVDLDTMTVEDLRDWYDKWYAPNNATLVVVGDVQPSAVFALAEKHFGGIKKSAIPVAKLRTEVEQKGQRNLVVKAPAKLPYLRMGFKTPGLINAKEKWEAYALEVLANILDGGSSARFAKKLIRDREIAASAGASYYGFGRLPDLFVLSGTPSSESTINDLREAFLTEIELLKNEKVSDEELKRVKAQVVASEVYERDSIEHIASILGSLESTGLGYELMEEYVPQILKVTAEQIQQVAQKYLIEDHLTIAHLEPQPLNSNAKKIEKGDQ